MNDFSQIYVVGDIHGCIALLKKIQQKIIVMSKNTPGTKLIIYLGDYIDRGPEIKETIQTLLDFQPIDFQRIFLLGNHEQMMLDFIKGEPDSLYLWILNGGDKTLNSYGVKAITFFEGIIKNDKTIRGQLIKKIPKDHLQFFNNLSLSYQYNDYFFVHAGIDPDIALNKQDKQVMIWTRGITYPKDFEKIIVHGHTPQLEIEDLPNRINLDTGAFYSGILSCLLIDSKNGKRQFFNTKK